jgi:hypothetical protein
VTEIFTIKPDPINDPEGKKLDQVVNAHLAYEHAQRVRSRWLSVLALASGLTWTVGDVSPHQLEFSRCRAFVSAALAAIVVRVIFAVAIEWHRRRSWICAVASHGRAWIS